jgi:hypothetical protein
MAGIRPWGVSLTKIIGADAPPVGDIVMSLLPFWSTEVMNGAGYGFWVSDQLNLDFAFS